MQSTASTTSQSSNDNKIQQISEILTKLKNNNTNNPNNTNNLTNMLNTNNMAINNNHNFPSTSLIQNFQINPLNTLNSFNTLNTFSSMPPFNNTLNTFSSMPSIPPIPPSLINNPLLNNNNNHNIKQEPVVSVSLSVLNNLMQRVKTYETFIEQLFVQNPSLNPLNNVINNNYPKDSDSQSLLNLFYSCLDAPKQNTTHCNNNINNINSNYMTNNNIKFNPMNNHNNNNIINNNNFTPISLPLITNIETTRVQSANNSVNNSMNNSVNEDSHSSNNSIVTSISSKHSDIVSHDSDLNLNSVIPIHTKIEKSELETHQKQNISSISRNKNINANKTPKLENNNNNNNIIMCNNNNNNNNNIKCTKIQVKQSENIHNMRNINVNNKNKQRNNVSTRSYNKKIGHNYVLPHLARLGESETTKKKTKISHVKDGEYYVCKECGKRYRYLCNLRSHSKVHTDSAHICEYCNKKFGRKANYEEHKRIHTGELPYKCNICKKRFRQRHGWRDHAKIHHNEKNNNRSISHLIVKKKQNKRNLDLPPLTPM